MEIIQMDDIDIENMKRTIEDEENIVSFSLLYDRKKKKMVFIKHGDEAIIDKMVNRAAYSIQGFADTIKKIAWRFVKPQNTFSNPFGFGNDPVSRAADDFLRGFKK